MRAISRFVLSLVMALAACTDVGVKVQMVFSVESGRTPNQSSVLVAPSSQEGKVADPPAVAKLQK
jgi:hypothetical protein